MITSQELRVGNLVSFINNDGDNVIFPVSGIGLDGINVASHEYFIDNEDLIPLEISEEILLKCGFVNEFSNSWSDHVLQIFKNNGNVAGAEIGDFYCSTGQRYVCSFKYLHQLQNLYFVLTGNELDTSELL